MTKATIAGLVAFINNQPASREIDHRSFTTCVVGDYCVEALGMRRSYDEIGPIAVQLFDDVGTCSHATRTDLMVMGGRPKITERLTVLDELSKTSRHGRATYGQLRLALSEKFPGLGIRPMKPAWFTEWSEKKFAELVGA